MNTTLSETGVEAALLPCPFCGGDAHLDPDHDDVVRCEQCHALGPFEDTFGQGIEAWNRRASVPSPTGGVPEGFKLVPVEPTEAMLEAMPTLPAIKLGDPLASTMKPGQYQNRVRYLAALAASPSPPTAAGAGEAVAWRYRNRYPLDPDLDAKSIARDGWEIVRHKPTWANEPDGTFDIQPLYAAPHADEVREPIDADYLRTLLPDFRLDWSGLRNRFEDSLLRFEKLTTYEMRSAHLDEMAREFEDAVTRSLSSTERQ